MACPRDLIEIAAALLTPTIAIAGVSVGIFQWRLSEARFRHEQFDRRFAVFEAVRDFIGRLLSTGYPTSEDQLKFLQATSGARFVFDAAVADFVKKIWDSAADLECLNSELKDMETGEERTRKIQERQELKKWFYEQLSTLEKRFEKQLAIRR